MSSRSEKAILNDVLMDLSALDRSVFYRNNSGTAWAGIPDRTAIGGWVKVEPRMKILRNAQPISFGFPGSGDIMGTHAGRAVAVEIKTEDGKQELSQTIFEENWVRAGGLYVLARSVSDARAGVLLG